MGLRDKLALGEWVRTNQRELDYGDNAPLIPQKKLPALGELDQNPLVSTINNLTDNLIPGGLLYGTERAAVDTLRISKFLVTGEGIAFAAKDSAGQLMNPESLISPTNKTRTPLNLLAQIPSNIAGLHFRRDGLLDTDIESNFNYVSNRGGTKYEQVFKDILSTDTEDTYDHTLIGLYTNLQLGQEESLIKEYSGGAASTFGIGTTRIQRYAPYVSPRDEEEIDNSKTDNEIRENIRSKYKLGNPGEIISGEIQSDPGRYSTFVNKTVDRVNYSDIIFREQPAEIEGLKDYIKFRMALIDTQNPLNDDVITFRAHLESINDSFTGGWNSFQYNGRAENFYVYNSFDRGIDFTFKIGAQTKQELKPLYKKLNYFVGSTAPEYVNRRMRGRFVRLTIGDWLYELPGFFPNISLSWSSNFPWELDESDDHFNPQQPASQHPMILEVRCNFKPIHDFTPENRINTPFIIRTKVFQNTDESTRTFNANSVIPT